MQIARNIPATFCYKNKFFISFTNAGADSHCSMNPKVIKPVRDGARTGLVIKETAAVLMITNLPCRRCVLSRVSRWKSGNCGGRQLGSGHRRQKVSPGAAGENKETQRRIRVKR